MSRIRNYFLTGLIVVGPVAVTDLADLVVRHLGRQPGAAADPGGVPPETYLPINIPGFGLIIAFVTCTLLGFLTANFVGSRLVDFGEGFLHRMPIVRPIYRTVKQIFQTLFSNSESSFRNVGLVEFPSPGMWSLVFLDAAADRADFGTASATEHVSAFLPCTPNPTTAFSFMCRGGRD